MRSAKIARKTNETEIELQLLLDGTATCEISTGIGFLDHLITLAAFHAGFDLFVKATGDLDCDDHHTVEDVGIVLGQSVAQALGDRKGINRYGFFLLPMDEVLARCVLDISGRAWLHYSASFAREQIGQLATENIAEFFRAFVRHANCTLHLDILTPGNDHHQAEALFKAFGRAMRQAISKGDGTQIPSTKGSLD